MFDPEKVERLSQIDVESVTPVGDLYDPLFIRASDYDALLKLYREYRDEAIRKAQSESDSQANYSSDLVPGCSYCYGSSLDRYFNPPDGTPHP